VSSIVVPSAGNAANLRGRRPTLDDVTESDSLSIVAQSSNRLAAPLPAPLPAGQTVALYGSNGAVSAIQISEQQQASPQAGSPNLIPPYPERAKDFAFIYAQGAFHVFYTRVNPTVSGDSSEIDFGHYVSTNLSQWTQLPPVLHVRANKWDNLHVWAPSILFQNGVYYMFYTGVTNVPYPYNQYQRIGVATSDDLMNWQRYDAPVYEGDMASWAFADSSQEFGCQFRDPFVMTDPSTPGDWLLYHAATTQVIHSQQIAGFAKSDGGLSPWHDATPMWSTDTLHFVKLVESPHVFSHGGKWYLFMSVLSGHTIRYQYADSPTADSSGWNGTYRLFDDDPNSDPWFASEFLRVGPHEYFAAANSASDGIDFREMTWTSVSRFTLAWPSVADVPPLFGSDAGLELRTIGNGSSHGGIRFAISLPSGAPGSLDIFDVQGRKVRRLFARALPAGPTVVSWDGRNEDGKGLGSGVYFARLETGLGVRSSKALLIR